MASDARLVARLALLATLHRVQKALDHLATSVTWNLWDGDEAAWLAATGWTPLAEWQGQIEQEFPPFSE